MVKIYVLSFLCQFISDFILNVGSDSFRKLRNMFPAFNFTANSSRLNVKQMKIKQILVQLIVVIWHLFIYFIRTRK